LPTLEVTVDPAGAEWWDLACRTHGGDLDGEPAAAFRERTREQLGLPGATPIVATGHQTLLWHPGILAKYLAVEAITAGVPEFARANLVVDQHADDFGTLEVPVQQGDGQLGTATIALTEVRPGVPMGRHPAFDPPSVPRDLRPALPSVAEGLERTLSAVGRHRDEPNAAGQMASALDELMTPWVHPMPRVCASDLIRTALGRRLVERMVADPARCVSAYNEAVSSVPEAKIGELAATNQGVELPLWRLGDGARRERATDHDARAWLAGDGPPLLPRALFLTALIRLGLCDLFVHGTGGARYDRAMERWVRAWLGLEPAPLAVVTATVILPFETAAGGPLDPDRAQHALRRLWHDPEPDASPGGRKRALLEELAAAPRRSAARLRTFHRMHEMLDELRRKHEAEIERARDRLATARRHAAEAPIRERRTWAFPLYPRAEIDELATRITATVTGEEKSSPRRAAEGRGAEWRK
jgi:hypothetical protein